MNYIRYFISFSAGDVEYLPVRELLHQLYINSDDIAHIKELPRHRKVAQLDFVFFIFNRLNDLGYDKIGALTATGMVKGPDDRHRQVIDSMKDAGDMLRRCFARPLGDDRLYFCFF